MWLCWSLFQVSVSPMFRWSLLEVELGKWFHLLGALGGCSDLACLLLEVTWPLTSFSSWSLGIACLLPKFAQVLPTCSWRALGTTGGHWGIAESAQALPTPGVCLVLLEVIWDLPACFQRSLYYPRGHLDLAYLLKKVAWCSERSFGPCLPIPKSHLALPESNSGLACLLTEVTQWRVWLRCNHEIAFTH